jgi:holo-[acyl-carrier protein] synthase
VEIERFDELLKRRPNIVSKIFTPDEIDYCNSSVSPSKHFAARFAAKEAFIKAFGLGMYKMPFRSIEVKSSNKRVPSIGLTNQACLGYLKDIADQIESVALSISHSKHSAVAVVIVDVKKDKQ